MNERNAPLNTSAIIINIFNSKTLQHPRLLLYNSLFKLKVITEYFKPETLIQFSFYIIDKWDDFKFYFKSQTTIED